MMMLFLTYAIAVFSAFIITNAKGVDVATENEFNAAIVDNAVINIKADIHLLSTVSFTSKSYIRINGGGHTLFGDYITRCLTIVSSANISVYDLHLTRGNTGQFGNGGGISILSSSGLFFANVSVSDSNGVRTLHDAYVYAVYVFINVTQSVSQSQCARPICSSNKQSCFLRPLTCNFEFIIIQDIGGGLYVESSSTITFSSCNFFDNTVSKL